MSFQDLLVGIVAGFFLLFIALCGLAVLWSVVQWVWEWLYRFEIAWMRRFRPRAYQEMLEKQEQLVAEALAVWMEERERQQASWERANGLASLESVPVVPPEEVVPAEFDPSTIGFQSTVPVSESQVTPNTRAEAKPNDAGGNCPASAARNPIPTANPVHRVAEVVDRSIVFPAFSPIVQQFKNAGVHLYHFTDVSNWESIQKHGAVFSRAELQAKSVSVRFLSSDGSRIADDRRGLSEFVHLSFHPDHSMLSAVRYRTEESVLVLKISLSVLDYPGCSFTRSLANATGSVQVPISKISEADLNEIVLANPDSKKWQLLVPRAIPMKFIREHDRHESLIPLWQ